MASHVRQSLRGLRAAAVAVALLLAGCGEDGPPALPVSAADLGDSPQHIHGLGVNPADDALYIATHTGLWRAPAGRRRAERVGDSRQDVMGFTVAGPDQFLGSGHPDARQDLPPLLGLIRSNDAGEAWTPVSLLGEADFHVLRIAGPRLYGFDATQERLLVSRDGGRSWAQHSPPSALLDLAVNPTNVDHIVASAEDGLFASHDAGRSWRPVAGPDSAGMLVWTNALILIDMSGQAHRSTDARTFDPVGHTGGPPAALAGHGRELYVALHDNTIKRSLDGGRTWVLRATA